jgi:hypothetical protein
MHGVTRKVAPLHLWGPQAFFPRSGKAHNSLMGGWAHELQHRYREALFGHTLFEETPFSLAQFGGEQALISLNVPLMSSQTGNSVGHSRHPAKKMFF